MQYSVEEALRASERLSRRGKLSGAESVLRRALGRFPRNRRLRAALGGVGAGALRGHSVAQLEALGDAWWRDGRAVPARRCYEAALAQAPDSVLAQMGLALIDRSEGRTESAIARYSKVIVDTPTLADPYRYISEMRTTVDGDGWIDTLTSALQIATADSARIPLCFALGKALADTGARDAAFAAYEMGNRLRHKQLGDRPLRRIQGLGAITQAFLAARAPEPLNLAPWGDTPRPIFVLGLPRSGTTLVERILAQHPEVAAGGERSELTDAIRAAGGPLGWPDAERAASIRAAYKASLERAEFDGAAWVTDKMPSNARWIPIIAQIFPEAHIIETQRNPIAVGWSLYRHCFAAEQMDFSYDLGDIAGYLRVHHCMTKLWHSMLPRGVRTVDYQRLTQDPEAEIRALLSDLDLPFDADCLHPEHAKTSVHTASFEQVRRTIYRDSCKDWRGFSEHLAPLRAAFGDSGTE